MNTPELNFTRLTTTSFTNRYLGLDDRPLVVGTIYFTYGDDITFTHNNQEITISQGIYIVDLDNNIKCHGYNFA